ncbi:SdiA-regulated domain-containing protein [Zooshikella sp. RANM57]|uniref:SdiA-regulated domain-containing protein n=1 Tax=Zooshikella sp. RANM57 TaxID=3425863 RepID=UPI003D6E3310
MRLLKRSIIILLALFLCWTGEYVFGWGSRLQSIVLLLTTSTQEQQQSIWLPSYSVDIEALPLSGADKNVSGITYSSKQDSLFVIVNQPPTVLEVDKQGGVVRKIPLEGFHDTEAIAYIGDDQFAIAEEREQRITLVEITNDTDKIKRDSQPQIQLVFGPKTNKGFEGIAADQSANRIIVVKERSPLRIYEIFRLKHEETGNFSLRVEMPENLRWSSLFMADLSGLHFDHKTRNLLLLSDESKRLTEVNASGETVSLLELRHGYGGLSRNIPQAEGVTLDDEENLYIVSEPNLLYRFRKVVQ